MTNKQITCINCPLGCRIKIDSLNNELNISGNKCQKGFDFAKAEMTFPVRSLTTTVKTVFENIPVLPVKTSGEVPKEKIPDIMQILSEVIIDNEINIGDVIINNIFGTGCNIVASGEITGASLR